MKRPQRRLHLLLWIVLAPAFAAGLALAMLAAPDDAPGDLPAAAVSVEAR